MTVARSLLFNQVRPLFLIAVTTMLLINGKNGPVRAAETESHSPVLAVTFSLIPGGGQFYNGEFIKAGILFTGACGLGAWRLAEPDADRRDDILWWMIGLYVYNLIDAYVDAHLYGFDQQSEENIIPPKYRMHSVEEPEIKTETKLH